MHRIRESFAECFYETTNVHKVHTRAVIIHLSFIDSFSFSNPIDRIEYFLGMKNVTRADVTFVVRGLKQMQTLFSGRFGLFLHFLYAIAGISLVSEVRARRDELENWLLIAMEIDTVLAKYPGIVV